MAKFYLYLYWISLFSSAIWNTINHKPIAVQYVRRLEISVSLALFLPWMLCNFSLRHSFDSVYIRQYRRFLVYDSICYFYMQYRIKFRSIKMRNYNGWCNIYKGKSLQYFRFYPWCLSSGINYLVTFENKGKMQVAAALN